MNKKIIMSILFIAGEPVELQILKEVLKLEIIEIEKEIIRLKEELENTDSPFEIIQIENKYTLTVKKEIMDKISYIFDKRQNPKLSNAALEVLSIVAYNDGVTRAQIESIRGTASDGSLHKLLEYGLITEAGRKETLGRPMSYKTTEKFLLTFGLNNKQELPKLEEIDIKQEIKQEI